GDEILEQHDACRCQAMPACGLVGIDEVLVDDGGRGHCHGATYDRGLQEGYFGQQMGEGGDDSTSAGKRGSA
ncbi:hypothetical protein LTR94_033310, partial [Friedmanniomyces endolithicus]